MENNYNANLPQAVNQQLEKIEVEAWHDLYQAASANTTKLGKIYSECHNNMAVSIVGAHDMMSLNRVIGLGLNAEVTEAEIESIIELYRKHNIPRFMVSETPSAVNLSELLLKKGFVHHNNWVKFYRDNSPVENVKSDLVVKQIDKSEAAIFSDMFYKAFDWPEITGQWLVEAIGRIGWYYYLVYDKDQPAGCGTMFVNGKTAWIVFGTTLPEFRGRGGQALITQRRIADAKKLGVELIAVETGQDRPERSVASYRNMLRSGFKTAYLRKNYSYTF